MKVTHRIPTTQYGFVEIAGECDTFEAARHDHDSLIAAFKEKPENTLPDKEMTDFIFSQLNEQGVNAETWEKMNPAQKTFVKLLKNAIGRRKPGLSDKEKDGLRYGG